MNVQQGDESGLCVWGYLEPVRVQKTPVLLSQTCPLLVSRKDSYFRRVVLSIISTLSTTLVCILL